MLSSLDFLSTAFLAALPAFFAALTTLSASSLASFLSSFFFCSSLTFSMALTVSLVASPSSIFFSILSRACFTDLSAFLAAEALLSLPVLTTVGAGAGAGGAPYGPYGPIGGAGAGAPC